MHFKEASEINFSQCKMITKNLLRKKLEVLQVGDYPTKENISMF